jgi:hypothetical protein
MYDRHGALNLSDAADEARSPGLGHKTGRPKASSRHTDFDRQRGRNHRDGKIGPETNTSFAKVPHRKRSFARQDEDHDQERHNRRHAPKDLQDLLREIADASRVPGFCPKRCRARPSSEHRGCGRLAVSPTGSRVGPFIVAGLSPRRSPAATFQPRNQSIVSAKPGIGDFTSRSLARRRTRPTRSDSNRTTVGLSARAITIIQDCVVPVGRLSIGTMAPRWRYLPYRPGRTWHAATHRTESAPLDEARWR